MPNIIAMGLKQGATLRAALAFDQAEWDQVFPADNIRCEARLGGVLRPVTVTPRQDLLCVIFSADTSDWPIGENHLDLRVERNGFTVYIPELATVAIPILEHVTEAPE
ncbi:hypothetical protein MU516_15505 [Paracoccus sp. YLB-12]|uniref:Uncharacterized protein n=1 Tax=Paracoccus maritimus TaxID=2933292 RepID=A0ABT2KCN4_9RHOB|nr:hypothetical protein [Paracoccus sp. YLB-12]MCT4334271.1 hypothetical protein [Paracoccus sp. YLB-12]